MNGIPNPGDLVLAWPRPAATWDSVGGDNLEATRPLAGEPGTDAPVTGAQWGGLLPNLLSTHPPFQIDGNYGFMATIAEMILQSHGGVVHVLPALPAEWPDGRASCLRCRGGVEADIGWRGGELISLTLRRRHGDGARQVRVRYGAHEAEVTLRPGEEAHLGPGPGWPVTPAAAPPAPAAGPGVAGAVPGAGRMAAPAVRGRDGGR